MTKKQMGVISGRKHLASLCIGIRKRGKYSNLSAAIVRQGAERVISAWAGGREPCPKESSLPNIEKHSYSFSVAVRLRGLPGSVIGIQSQIRYLAFKVHSWGYSLMPVTNTGDGA